MEKGNNKGIRYLDKKREKEKKEGELKKNRQADQKMINTKHANTKAVTPTQKPYNPKKNTDR